MAAEIEDLKERLATKEDALDALIKDREHADNGTLRALEAEVSQLHIELEDSKAELCRAGLEAQK